MEDLPLNRLRCAGCRSTRSIFDYPFRPDGRRYNTCYYCRWLKQGIIKPLQKCPPRLPLEQALEQSLQQTSQGRGELQEQQEEQPSQPPSPRYCSSCNQRRQPSQFSRFKTCEICRATNRKAQYRKKHQRHANKYPQPSL